MRYDFMNVGELITRLPFCNLQPHALESFGSLRARPKWDSGSCPTSSTSYTAQSVGQECPVFQSWLAKQPLLPAGELSGFCEARQTCGQECGGVFLSAI